MTHKRPGTGDSIATDRVLRCWGKTHGSADDPDAFHPAVYHMLDAGNVARSLLGPQVSARWRNVLGSALGSSPDAASAIVPFMVSLHDLGKLSVPFQHQDVEQRRRLAAEGFDFGGWLLGREPHHRLVGHVTLRCTTALLGEGAPPPSLLTAWCNAISSHHGRFAGALDLGTALEAIECSEPPDWAELRRDAAALLWRELVAPPVAWPNPPNVSAAAMTLAGFSTLCDWLASDATHFPPRAVEPWPSYTGVSRRAADKAVAAAGFSAATLSAAPAGFANLFTQIPVPRPLQLAVDDVPDGALTPPCLVIIEAPTGEGKTEAALALAHRIARLSGTDEMYYALPTMATSNQMFERLNRYMDRDLGLQSHAKLVHGQAFVLEDALDVKPLAGDIADQAAVLGWFMPKKRALLAPFGVGTIDQVELAALNVPHVTLRLAGLAGKVVILDEVHAYDTYMTTIVERLLRWLHALGASVVLLSATLPGERKARLVRAFGPETESIERHAYPSIWAIGPGQVYAASPAAFQPARMVNLRRLAIGHDEPAAKAAWLLQAVQGGGCACWITNTVRRAQDVFRALEQTGTEDVDLTLLHSQFCLEDRQKIEERLQGLYGPQGARPSHGIVVGTQVLEQSLDLDFDVMVSDPAPIDLLLQRAGRLHRHNRTRPDRHAEARLWLNTPASAGGSADIAVDTHIYAEYLLRKTLSVLDGVDRLELPAGYRTLVEAVYGAGEPAHGDPLRKPWEEMQSDQRAAAADASFRLLPLPRPDVPFCAEAASLVFTDDEESTGWIVAKTRRGEEGITVIPLERRGQRVILGAEAIALNQAPSHEQELRLLRRSLRVSARDLVEALREAGGDLPPLFKSGHRLKGTVPLWLRDGACTLERGGRQLQVRLDPSLGLTVTRPASARAAKEDGG